MAILRGLDKITGQPAIIDAPIGVPVHYATLTITAEFCYSTPPSETPETTAFLEVVDRRPNRPARKVFSGWMWASSPSLNAMEHPLYDVWVISCKTNEPGQQAPPVASSAPVKPVSPNQWRQGRNRSASRRRRPVGLLSRSPGGGAPDRPRAESRWHRGWPDAA